MGKVESLSSGDLEHQYLQACAAVPTSLKVIMQNIQRMGPFDKLFYTPVSINNTFQVQEMLEFGSMACTLSEQAELKMLSENILSEPIPLTQEIVLIGCGGT